MIALMYPGQGSQHVGMGKFLYDNFSLAKLVFEEASDAIEVDLKKLCFDGPESDLTLTHNTQPALLTVSTATHRVLASLAPLKPVAAAGHSIGEYAAVVNAGAMDLSLAVSAVRLRGLAMQEAVPEGLGGMAAVMGADEKQIDAVCAWVNKVSGAGPLEPANYNAPGQIVVSGKKAAIEWLSANYAADKVTGGPARMKLIPLKVSAPFHCSMMIPAEKKMAAVLKEIPFKDADYPILQNVSGEAVTIADQLRQNLVQQISASVRWIDCVQGLKKLGASTLLEIGCGKVLSGLAKKIDSDGLTTLNINSLEELKAAEEMLTGQNGLRELH